MTTITLKVPDELEAHLPASDAEREQYVLDALREKIDQDRDLEETVAALEEGFADIATGRTRPLAEFIAEQEAAWAAKGLSRG
jgi:predicted transcriptional regulator